MANKDDFRYKATERAINEAFMQLAKQKSVRDLSVSELCQQAGISRNAFYLHYAGMPALCCALVGELAASIKEDCLASTAKVISTKNPDTALPDTIFDSFENHEDLIRILLGTDDGEIAKQFAQGLAETYSTSAAAFGEPHERLEHRLMCSFTAWAHVGFLKRWIAESDAPFAEARPCFVELQAQVMLPHFQLLARSR